MSKPKIAVVLFPGNNTEDETIRVLGLAGMLPELIRWNQGKLLHEFDGYVLLGGFAYEDRIRAGIIAAKDPIMDIIKKEAGKGKPVLGICNGAQVLIETGMVPGLENKVQMALAPNINPFVSGYYCTWINIKNEVKNEKCAFTKTISKNDIIPIPIAHGEGRFITKDKELLNKLIKNKQVIFRYCDKKGKIIDKFPINPNGSMYAIAGICNPEGNVMAMMPHPERGYLKRMMPGFEAKPLNEMNQTAPAFKIFESMKEYIK